MNKLRNFKNFSKKVLTICEQSVILNVSNEREVERNDKGRNSNNIKRAR